ncbi:serine/threonine protein kinase [Salipaludibacillus daqingensis]|uniref:serine/threonine protein kinase n=1 Tax=Salipaludibacillus daqingensis TaxID=3041001 RepID=UPI002473F155|nr:serine/threonine-protein kinase [Salipaludibacillus daqingensis]
MAKHNIDLKPEDVLRDTYKIVRHIGSGGMSAVFLANEIEHEDKLWAIKVADMSQKISRRLLSEAKMLSELDHPALPQIADFFSSEDEQYFYLVQEYVDGRSLYDTCEVVGFKLDESVVLDIGVQLCDVLAYLHNQEPPVIYRDLKPGNIMITGEGKVKLIDFGIARKFDHLKLKDTVQIGTVGFAAPEQFEREQSDTRTDLFSLGALLYFLLTGGKYVYVAQKPVEAFQEGLTKNLRKSIEGLTKLDRDKRIQHVDEVKELLLAAQKDLKKKKGPVKMNKKRLSFIFAGVGSTVALLTVLFIILF